MLTRDPKEWKVENSQFPALLGNANFGIRNKTITLFLDYQSIDIKLRKSRLKKRIARRRLNTIRTKRQVQQVMKMMTPSLNASKKVPYLIKLTV